MLMALLHDKNLEMGLITRILIRVRIRVRNVITESEVDEETYLKMLPSWLIRWKTWL